MILIKFVSVRSSNKFALKRSAQSSKMGTAIKGFHARLANQPLLVLTFGNSGAQPWAPECPKGKTKNGVVSLNSCSYFSNAELKWVNGPDRAIGVCVCVCVCLCLCISLCVRTITFECSDLLPRHLTSWFSLVKFEGRIGVIYCQMRRNCLSGRCDIERIFSILFPVHL